MIILALIGTEFGKSCGDLVKDIFALFDDAGAYTYPVDPLIFDLNGDGVKTISVNNGIQFDFDNNGFEALAYYDKSADGLLDSKDSIYAVDYMGDDTVTGGIGNDVLAGEMDDDILRGGNGDDTYIFRLGDGKEAINEQNGIDRIVFGEGIHAEDIHIS